MISSTIKLLALFSLSFSEQAFAQGNPWAKTPGQFSGKAESIGTYTAGCLIGGEELALSSRHHEVMLPSRRRYYGHPDLIRFVQTFSETIFARYGKKVLVGDLSQPRGGPTMSKHVSHQIGLDADIWLSLHSAKKKVRREGVDPPDTVDHKRKKVSRNYGPHVAVMIETAAKSELVERVLVNPILKRELCRQGKAPWLAKVRPWWGHSKHMHIRLACPKDSVDCVKQEATPSDEGCDATLEWWFSKEAEEEFKKIAARMENPVMPELPNRCKELISK